MFVGRKQEIKQIEKSINSFTKELIAISGKRGIGKTELALKVISNKNNVMILNGKYFNKMEATLKEVSEIFNSKFNTCYSFHSWTSFFNSLLIEIKKQDLETEPFILFIDEFPWLNTKGSNFIDHFSAFWNNIISSLRVKIILTGSAVSWMNKYVFQSKGGLFHRVTCKISLKSFDLLETKQFLIAQKPFVSTSEILDYYNLTGGVARYLNILDLTNSLSENATKLFREYDYKSFFKNSFNSIKTNIHLKIISLFKERIKLSINEILSELSEFSNVTIYNALKELEDTDVILSINEDRKTKSPDYILVDLFLFFAIRNENQQLFKNTQRFNILKGYAFEISVIRNIHLVLKEIGRFKEMDEFSLFKWQNDKSQIDLIVDYKTNFYSIVECKYYSDVYELGQEEAKKIEKRQFEFANNFGNKKTLFDVVLCTAFGSKNKTHLSYKEVNFENILS